MLIELSSIQFIADRSGDDRIQSKELSMGTLAREKHHWTGLAAGAEKLYMQFRSNGDPQEKKATCQAVEA